VSGFSSRATTAECHGYAGRVVESPPVELLGPAEIRSLTQRLGVRPTKKLGQNFVHDPNTVRRIVSLAELDTAESVLEVGPGLGSLTLGLLEAGAEVTAVEVDESLADLLTHTVAERATGVASRLSVHTTDALRLVAEELPREPSALVANLPYNVAVPVVLHLLAALPSLRHGLVMVQAEVADRIAAAPGSRWYGVPSVKFGYFGRARRVGAVPRSVFWPVPNVDSALLEFRRDEEFAEVPRQRFFAVVDAAFAQRRKTLRAALSGWAGSPPQAETLLRAAEIDPRSRAEQLAPEDFARLTRVSGP